MKHGSVAERLRLNGVKTFKMPTERILEDLDCIPEQKLKGTVYLLREKAYRWWQSIVRGTQAGHLIWEYFQEAFQNKYVGTRYVEARRLKEIRLCQDMMLNFLGVTAISKEWSTWSMTNA
ncbi:ATP-dependent zinc metalloprotease FtsH [Gossypium australe]|uniref:ATP-dependent zinc metalloprotease FtsH n=1 Tax=Gossypium australe TaxID=47621 RepID=A0A5B6VZ77_9ROSI|nr:ATP-dependent zinc metalloprotease FtsH [Gossypium australe]